VTAKETYQRPHELLETVTVVGSIDAGSMSGQDQANSSGVLVLARKQAAVAVPEPGAGVLGGLAAAARVCSPWYRAIDPLWISQREGWERRFLSGQKARSHAAN
jgi:hypothetical protein